MSIGERHECRDAAESATSASLIETFAIDGSVAPIERSAVPLTRISIGILAYNEESAIAQTIASIGEQTLLRGRPVGWIIEIVCVPNGCQDRTAEMATRAFDDLRSRFPSGHVATRVEVVQKASKENAWNEFVHRISDRAADFLVLMDGNVRLLDPDSLRSMVEALRRHPRAYVCGARTVKHLELKRSRSLIERISLGASLLRRSSSSSSGNVGFAGCLYAARASACRRFRLPSIMRGEDCFLRAIEASPAPTGRTIVGRKDAS